MPAHARLLAVRFAALAASLVLGGCSATSSSHSSNLSASSASSPPSSSAPAPSPPVATESDPAPATSTTVAPSQFGPGPFSLLDPSVGLDQLASYTATLTLSFVGTKAGQPLQFEHTYVLNVSHDLNARLLTIQSVLDAANTSDFHAEVNGTVYATRADGTCTASVPGPVDATATTDESLPTDTAAFDPASLLNGFIGADVAQPETVNNVPSKQYTFDERALGNLDPAVVSARAWIASSGGYVTRYTLTSKGPRAMLGNDGDGTLTLDYELTAVNQSVNVVLPAGCPAQIDAPLLPDATGTDRQPGYITYSSPTKPADALAFYQQQLPTLGWAPTADIPAVSDQGGQIGFTSASGRLTIAASIDETGATTVLIVQEQ